MQKNTSPDQRALRLLSLDGGGIRGLSELVILEEIMARIQHLENLEKAPLPCDYFDLIGGVGTGGLIALLLGRLRMSTADAIQVYVRFTKQVFSSKKFGAKDTAFKATEFENAIKSIIKSITGQENTLMRDQTIPGCPSFVCAIPAANMSKPRLFRTYEVKANQSYNCTIWEAARATTAVPKFFKRIFIGDGDLKEEFLGASLGWNNPVGQVLEEAESLFGSTCQVACVVSIGGGHPDIIAWQPDTLLKWQSLGLIDVLRQISTNCEDTAEQFEKRYKNIPGLYFRLSVEQGMQKVSLVDWQRLGEVKTHTTQYLLQSSMNQKIDKLAGILHECPQVITIGKLNGPSVLVPNFHIKMRLLDIAPPTAIFVGREDILSQLEQVFDSDETSIVLKKQLRFVLYGLGGAGKTQIVLKFVERNKNQFSRVYFIDASTITGIELALKGIGQEAIGIDATAMDGLFWLSQLQQEWLLVFDNADDPEINLQDFFPPSGHGNIVITSCNSACCIYAPEHHCMVTEIGHDDAIQLLLRTSGRTADPEANGDLASEIVNELGHLALAIVQAGAYLMQDKGLSFQRYLQYYRKHRVKYNSHKIKQTADGYKMSIYATWNISFAKLTAPAARLLQICAFFHYTGITSDLFQQAAIQLKEQLDSLQADKDFAIQPAIDFLNNFLDDEGAWDEYEFQAVIQNLSSYSLIQPGKEDTYSIHPLVHAWASDCETAEAQKETSACAIHILNCSILNKNKTENFKHNLALVPHLTKLQGMVTGELHDAVASRFGQLYMQAGQWNKAEDLLHYAYKKSIVMSRKPEDVLTAMGNLAIIYEKKGKWSEAEKLDIEVLEKRLNTLGEDHLDTLDTMAHLATIYGKQGKWKEAEELNTQVLKKRREILEENHLDILVSMGHLAMIYWEQGQWKKAEELEVHVLTARKQMLGPEHPETLTSMNNLAATYQSLGQWKDAMQLQEQVIEGRKRLYGLKHPQTLLAMENLALMYGDQGRLKEAEQLSLDVLEARTQLYGIENAETLNAMGNLGFLYLKQGHFNEAEKLNLQVVEARKRVLGEEHPDTLKTMSNLALTYENQAKWKLAEQLGLQLLEIKKRVLGENHPDTLTTKGNLAMTLESMGKTTEAEQIILEVLKARNNVLGKDHPDVLLTMANLVVIYWKQGRWMEAEILGTKVLEARQRLPGPDHPETLTAKSNLAGIYQRQGKWNEAKELSLQVLEARTKLLGLNHPETLISMNNVASSYRIQGELDNAEQLGVKVVQLRKEVLGPEHPDTLFSMNNLALTYQSQGLLEKAEALMLEVLESTKMVFGPMDSTTLERMNILDDIQQKLKVESNTAEYNEARNCLFG